MIRSCPSSKTVCRVGAFQNLSCRGLVPQRRGHEAGEASFLCCRVEVCGLGSRGGRSCGSSVWLRHNAVQVIGGEIREISELHADGLAPQKRIELLSKIRLSRRVAVAGRDKILISTLVSDSTPILLAVSRLFQVAECHRTIEQLVGSERRRDVGTRGTHTHTHTLALTRTHVRALHQAATARV